MKKILLVFLMIILLMTMSSCGKNSTVVAKESDTIESTDTKLYEIMEAYKYPIVQGTKEWAELDSMPAKIEATYVDPEILCKMSTPALVETVVTYPLFVCVNAYDTLDTGVKEVSEYFKGIEVLCSRDDARDEILKYINDRCPGLAEMKNDDEISSALRKYMEAYNESGDLEVFYIDNAVTLINYMDGCSKSKEETGRMENVHSVVQAKDIIEALDADTFDAFDNMRGKQSGFFENWNEAVDYIGIEPWNPFENADWLKKMNYAGANIKEGVTGVLQHCYAYIFDRDGGNIEHAYLETGYAYGKTRVVMNDHIKTASSMDSLSGEYSMVKFYQLVKENGNIKVHEGTAKEQGYICVVGIQNGQSAVSINMRFYKDDELKYEIRLTSLEDIDDLEEPFNKVCEELSIPLKYDTIF